MPACTIPARLQILNINVIPTSGLKTGILYVSLNSENQAESSWPAVIHCKQGLTWAPVEPHVVDLIIEQLAFASYVKTFRPRLYAFFEDQLIGHLDIAS